jgi:hypothetical protein
MNSVMSKTAPTAKKMVESGALVDRSEITPADDAHPLEARPRIKSRPSPTIESIVGEIS